MSYKPGDVIPDWGDRGLSQDEADALNEQARMALEEPARDAAWDYLRKIGLEPTPDAVGQLSGPFTAALRIMCERGYDPEGRTWRIKGWKGLVHDILNKAGRLRYRSWQNNDFNPDDVIDMANFCGFLWREGNKGSKWGQLGEPG